MTLGTYEIPKACQRYCNSIHKSTLWAIQSFECYCLNEEATLSDFMANSKTFSDYKSCPASQISFNDHLSYGFATLNFSPHFVKDLPLRPHYCGSDEIGGSFKCGSRDTTDTTAVIYGFTSFEYSDRSYFPLSELKLKIFDHIVGYPYVYTITVSTREIIEITILYSFCQLPCYLSDDGKECLCSNIPVWLGLTYTDGSSYETYQAAFVQSGLQFLHYFNNSGSFGLTLSAANNVYRKSTNVKVVFNVIDAVEYVEVESVKASPIVIGQTSEIKLTVFTGKNFVCNVNHGDRSPVKTYHYKTKSAIESLWYRYRQSGLYRLTVACSVGNHVRETFSWVVVQDVVLGLQTASDFAISYDQVYEHRWNLLKGSHVCCKVFMGNHRLEETSSPPDSTNLGEGKVFFDRDTNKGIAFIPIPNNEIEVTYAVTVACSNVVTERPEIAVTYVSFDTAVKDIVLTLSSGRSFYKLNEAISLLLSVASGSNFLTCWNFGANSGHNDVVEFCNKPECKSR